MPKRTRIGFPGLVNLMETSDWLSRSFVNWTMVLQSETVYQVTNIGGLMLRFLMWWLVTFHPTYGFSLKNYCSTDEAATQSSNTCLRIVKRTTEEDYNNIVKEGGCWSYVGRRGGMQKVSLSYRCYRHFIFIHECMHASRFYHEQSRSDRHLRQNTIWKHAGRRCRETNISHTKLRPLESPTITNPSCTTELTIPPTTARKRLYAWMEAMIPLETK